MDTNMSKPNDRYEALYLPKGRYDYLARVGKVELMPTSEMRGLVRRGQAHITVDGSPRVYRFGNKLYVQDGRNCVHFGIKVKTR